MYWCLYDITLTGNMRYITLHDHVVSECTQLSHLIELLVHSHLIFYIFILPPRLSVAKYSGSQLLRFGTRNIRLLLSICFFKLSLCLTSPGPNLQILS